MKIAEIIDKLKTWHEPYTEGRSQRDKVLYGNPDQECTGIAITVCATFDVIQKAAAQHINLIISHESIFYGGSDEDFLKNDTYKEKVRLMEEHGIVIWRDHDRMHGNGGHGEERVRNDYIFYGICKSLGWEQYVIGDTMKPLWYKVPKTTARKVADELIEKCNLNGLRVVGNLDAEVETIWFAEHVQGGKFEGNKLDGGLEADVMIPFEIVDFTLTQYVFDSAAQGRNKVLLEMGHFNAEEIGMRYMTEWIREILPESLPAVFIQSGDFFQYYK